MSREINVVLVGTLYPTNIGSAARAMGNMGGHRLILVKPQCEVNSEARRGAAGAQSRLEGITIYKDWDDFYANEGTGLRIGFTRRDGKLRRVWPFKERLKLIQEQNPKVFVEPIYLVFGPEDNGLEDADLALLNYRCSLPAFGDFPSMNLAQAVFLALYISQDFFHDGRSPRSKSQKKMGASRRRLVFPDQTIRDWITAMGFDIEARQTSAYTTFKRLLLQNTPTENELLVLEAILQQNIRKLKDQKVPGSFQDQNVRPSDG